MIFVPPLAFQLTAATFALSLFMSVPASKTSEGYLPFKVPSIPTDSQTWYKIIGELKPGVRPLIALHGGPGSASAYLEILSDITNGHPSPLIVYDQIGCGKSTHFRDKFGDAKFWTEQLFVDEFNNLVKRLKIKEYDLIGHSWGGMLAARLAVAQPPELKHLVLFSTLSSMARWADSQTFLRSKLPKDIQDTLSTADPESPEWGEALGYYESRHVCTLDPIPEPIMKGFEAMTEDPTVLVTMYGPYEFHLTGTLANWTIIDEVHKINVPTLLVNGAADVASDIVVAPFVRNIPNVKWVEFAKSSHMAHFEQREEFMSTVEQFLYRR